MTRRTSRHLSVAIMLGISTAALAQAATQDTAPALMPALAAVMQPTETTDQLNAASLAAAEDGT
jgi:hypothetical protein